MSAFKSPDDGDTSSKKSGNSLRPSSNRGPSWLERMHKKHHERKHGRNTDESEAAPLLAEDVRDDEEAEDVEAQPERNQSRVGKVQKQARVCFDKSMKETKRAFDTSYEYVQKNWKIAVIALICAGLTVLAGIVLSGPSPHCSTMPVC